MSKINILLLQRSRWSMNISIVFEIFGNFLLWRNLRSFKIINGFLFSYYRSDHNPHVRHRRPWLLGDRKWGSPREVQDWSIAVGFPVHHQPAGSRDFVCGLQTRVLGVGSICGLLIKEVRRSQQRMLLDGGNEC